MRLAKAGIIKGQINADYLVVNQDYETSAHLGENTLAKTLTVSTQKPTPEGSFIQDGEFISNVGDQEVHICATADKALLGDHNLENILPAITVARILGIEPHNIASVIKSFKGLPHRLELVAEKDGIKYYNDSFSTTPETSIAAIKSFTQPVILIAGGSEKNSDFTEWAQTCAQSQNLKEIVLTGHASADRMAQDLEQANFKQTLTRVENLEQAVHHARNFANPGDVILLSPACASFEEFPNYKVRGESFKAISS